MQGWIKIHRKLLLKGYANKPAYMSLWLHLLLMASHCESEFLWNGELKTIQIGQLLTGRKELSKQTGIPETTIERILKVLESGHQIHQQKTSKYRLITILNWGKHQVVDNKRTTNGQQTDTFKNVRMKEDNISDAKASHNQKDMFKIKEEAVVDYDTGEVVPDSIDAEKAEVRGLNEKIRHNLKLVEDARGLPFGKGRDMNYHVKIYRELLQNGWTHQSLVSAMLELVNSDHWITERKVGQYPGMNTVQFLLRNKKPV